MIEYIIEITINLFELLTYLIISLFNSRLNYNNLSQNEHFQNDVPLPSSQNENKEKHHSSSNLIVFSEDKSSENKLNETNSSISQSANHLDQNNLSTLNKDSSAEAESDPQAQQPKQTDASLDNKKENESVKLKSIYKNDKI